MAFHDLQGIFIGAQNLQIISREVISVSQIVERSDLCLEIVDAPAETERLAKAGLLRRITSDLLLGNPSTVEGERLPGGVAQLVVHLVGPLREVDRRLVIALGSCNTTQSVQDVSELARRLAPT